jgi:endonuclease YncB( thermonuclease family)
LENILIKKVPLLKTQHLKCILACSFAHLPMKERFIIFGTAFMVSCFAVMFFLHIRKVRSGEASLLRRWVNSAGEIGAIKDWLEADTFTVELPEGTMTVRLNALDTPKPLLAGGSDALALATQIVGDDPVRVLEFRRNQAGDIIGEVYNSDNASLNEELMKAGWAWYYEPDAPNNPYYREMHESAVAEKRGLWSLADPTPPWLTTPRDTSRKGKIGK